MGKTYKDNANRGYDKKDKDQKRQQDRRRKQMNIDCGEFWDKNKKFQKNNYIEDDYEY